MWGIIYHICMHFEGEGLVCKRQGDVHPSLFPRDWGAGGGMTEETRNAGRAHLV